MTEQQPYTVLVRFPEVELRRYEPCVVAEILVSGGVEDAGLHAFRHLAGYIGGRNRERRSVAMTAPVLQQQGADDRRFAVAFVMPAGETVDTLPAPEDPDVRLRVVPGECAAALRYRGRWSGSGYEQRAAELSGWLADAGIAATGPARWARYDPPWTTWFLRRNEVIIPVDCPA